jgi:hypothetical protein
MLRDGQKTALEVYARMEEAGLVRRSLGEALRGWMEQKGVSRCPACGTEDWWAYGQTKIIAAPCDPVRKELWTIMDSDVIVQVPCGNCAYLMSFRAESVGALESVPSQEE